MWNFCLSLYDLVVCLASQLCIHEFDFRFLFNWCLIFDLSYIYVIKYSQFLHVRCLLQFIVNYLIKKNIKLSTSSFNDNNYLIRIIISIIFTLLLLISFLPFNELNLCIIYVPSKPVYLLCFETMNVGDKKINSFHSYITIQLLCLMGIVDFSQSFDLKIIHFGYFLSLK